MTRYIFAILLLLLLCVGANAQMPARNPAWVQVNPWFEGMEAGYSSATVNAFNYYGNYWWDVLPGVVVGAPHNVLSVTHADTTPAVLVVGDVLIVDAGGNLVRLPAGALNDVLTQGVAIPAWAAAVGVGHNILSATHLDAAIAALVAGDVLYVDGAGDLNRLPVAVNGDVFTLVGGAPIWQAPVAAAVRLDQVLSPNANTFWAMTTNQLRLLFTNPAVADGGLEIEASGAFAGDLIHVHQHTGNPGAVDLLHIEADDVDVLPFRVDAANNGIMAIDTTGYIQMDDGNQAAGFIVMDDGAGTGVMEWVDPATIPGMWGSVGETTIIVAGADYTVMRSGVAIANIEDTIVAVTCRSPNSGVMWNALSHPTPVADMVTFYWVEHGDGDIAVHIVNDSSLDIRATISFAEL